MHEKSWNKLINDFKSKLTDDEFSNWFTTIKYIKSDDENVFIQVPNEFHKDWLMNNYMEQINKDFNNIIGKKVDFQILIDGSPKKMHREKLSAKKTGNYSIYNNNLIPTYIFDRFIVGENNEFAHAAALKVAQSPGKAYNPLFLYGGVGLGKTHLMHAIGNQLLKKDINLKIEYLTSEEFMNLFVGAIRKKTQNRFRNRFRNLDILLIDDVQYLLSKTDTKTELFNTFNALYGRKKQIIISSDRTPSQLKLDGMDDRLSSRVGSGLNIEIRPPSVETRKAILLSKAEEKNIKIPNEVIELMAEIEDADIRHLEQALTDVIARHELLHKEITLEFAEEILDARLKTEQVLNFTFDKILKETSNVFNVSTTDIKSKSRRAMIVNARQIVMLLSRELIGMSYKDIGIEIGREHPTIISGINKINSKLKKERILQNQLEEINNNLHKKV